MNLIELQRRPTTIRLGGIATCWKPDCAKPKANHGADRSDLVSDRDELSRRSERLLDRRRKQAEFRDAHKTLDQFDFNFNPKMNRSLVFDLATCAFIGKREDACFSPGRHGKSHLARPSAKLPLAELPVMYRETHVLLDNLAEAVARARANSSWSR